ncbi:serine/threonine-protein phosphatase 6 regulatory ankyrin repeat subunit B [Setaria italica]|uniref:serine/threonine-protein phosphatase 6 regulatory ankyrin repeat subunit B n=1 Tax=Setaria italica TaxID=4555 RepID=UPI000BE53D0B|nr:serine/threonine-protein phosphatase 6 regulatory ankyrin repeat subunit B [Setaria italica]
MAPSTADVAIQAASDGNLRLLKGLASDLELRGVKGIKGRSLLHFAAAGGHLEVCKFLVDELGFHANSTSTVGESICAGHNVLPVLRYLLERGGDPALPDARGSTPLHNAAKYGHDEAVRLLLSKGVPVDPLNHHGTRLHVAVGKDQDQALKILLEHGADPNRVVDHVLSPLTLACIGCSLKCMKLLVEAGADVNFKKVGAGPNIHDRNEIFPIMLAAAHEHRELVEILFPQTKPIPFVPDWSVDGIIRTTKYLLLNSEVSVEKQIDYFKSQGKEAFAKGDYLDAAYFYLLAIEKDPLDGTLFSNRSLCWLRLREGEKALSDAQHCKTLRPRWAKAWYREGAALSLLKDYKGAVDAFLEASKLDPASDEIQKALREAVESTRNAGYSTNPPAAAAAAAAASIHKSDTSD